MNSFLRPVTPSSLIGFDANGAFGWWAFEKLFGFIGTQICGLTKDGMLLKNYSLSSYTCTRTKLTPSFAIQRNKDFCITKEFFPPNKAFILFSPIEYTYCIRFRAVYVTSKYIVSKIINLTFNEATLIIHFSQITFELYGKASWYDESLYLHTHTYVSTK